MKTVLITGAGRGIGYFIAKRLCTEDYNVVLHYNKSKEGIDKLLKFYKEHNKTPLIVQGDISKEHEVKNFFNIIRKNTKGVDILINNAGISHNAQFQDLTSDDFKKLFDVNVFGTFNTIKEAINYMISQKNGSILNFSSIWGARGASCEVLYSSTKGAIESLTRSLALELAPSNIRVNAIAPGTVNTDMMKCYSKDDLHYICEEIPMNRIAEPEEIAELVCFLISDKNSYMTGQIISPNGGMGV